MIQFVYQNRVHNVKELAPSTSLLQYLRVHLVQTGTKEGCAAGDCGACTVVVGELINGELSYKAINACIAPLASLHGKHVVVVEDLAPGANKLEQLHPVQRAMVECHGSQCGFCTPGFVMSLYAWWLGVKSGQIQADRHSVELALSGNLCRCTGYQSILRAAQKSLDYDYGVPDFDQIKGQIEAIKNNGLDEKTLVADHFLRPKNCTELIACKEKYPDAQLIAGATDLGLDFTQALKNPERLIYTKDVAELNLIEETSNQLSLGAGITYTDAYPAIANNFPAFAGLLDRLGSLQIRNQGTLGGNIANASPIGDTPPVLLALNAKLIAVGVQGEREIAIDQFFTGYRQTALARGEALKTVVIPKLTSNAVLSVYKISKRFDDDISAVCMAIWIQFDRPTSPSQLDLVSSSSDSNTLDSNKNAVIKDIRIGCGGMAATPARAFKTEQALVNKTFDNAAIAAAKAAIFQDFAPIDDVRASAKYRLAVAANLLERCQQELLGLSEPPLWDPIASVPHNRPIVDPSDALQPQSPLYYDAQTTFGEAGHSQGGAQ